MESISIRSHVEQALIAPLFHTPMFSADDRMVRLASYPRDVGEGREETILELVKLVGVFQQKPKLLESYRLLDHFIKASGKRSHFIHQFEVFLLGWYLLAPILKQPKLRVAYFGNVKISEIQAVWLTAAISHDLGRPFEMATGISRRLKTLLAELGMKRTSQLFGNETTENLLEQEIVLTEALVGQPEGHFSKRFSFVGFVTEKLQEALGLRKNAAKEVSEEMRKRGDHGLVSGLVLAWAVLEPLVAGNGVQNLGRNSLVRAFGKAIGAVSTHALKPGGSSKIPQSLISRLSMKRNPYAFLLFLVDNLQDWSRIAVGERDNAEIELIDISFRDMKLTLEYELRHSNWPTSAVSRVRAFLRAKRHAFRLLKQPSPPMGLQLHIKYRTNRNQLFSPIVIAL